MTKRTLTEKFCLVTAILTLCAGVSLSLPPGAGGNNKCNVNVNWGCPICREVSGGVCVGATKKNQNDPYFWCDAMGTISCVTRNNTNCWGGSKYSGTCDPPDSYLGPCSPNEQTTPSYSVESCN